MFYTLAVAIGAYYIVKLLSLRFIIFGKRRFALLIVFSFLLHVIVTAIAGGIVHDFSSPIISIIGYTVPGIIASNMQKQGVVKTSLSLAIVVGILELCVVVLTTTGVMV